MPNTLNKKGIKYTLLLASTLTTMSTSIISPSLPKIAEVFSYIPNSVLLSKLVLTLPALLIAFTAPLAGKWIDIHGRLKLFTIGLILFCIGGTSGFFLSNLYLILAGRAVLGVSVGMIMTIVTTLMGDFFEGKERQEILGLRTTFVSIGGMVFVVCAGFLADVSWRLPFLIYSAGLIVLLFSLKYLVEPELKIYSKSEKKLSKRSPYMYLVFATAFTAMMLLYAFPSQFPFQLKKLGIEKNAITGLALGLNTLAMAIGSLVFTKLKSRFSFAIVLAIGFGFLGVGNGFIWQIQELVMNIIGLTIAGFGMGLILPSISLWMLNLSAPENRGGNVGLLTTFMFLGAFASPIIIQPIINAVELSATFGIIGGFALLLAIGFASLGSKQA